MSGLLESWVEVGQESTVVRWWFPDQTPGIDSV